MKYRGRDGEVEAICRDTTTSNALEILTFGGASVFARAELSTIMLVTPHGDVTVRDGDWLVKEENGDVHLCASSDFHTLYVRRKSLREVYADCALTAMCLDPALNGENDASGPKSGGNE